MERISDLVLTRRESARWDANALALIEDIFTAINTHWENGRSSPSYDLLNPYSDVESWSSEASARYSAAEASLCCGDNTVGSAALALVMYSDKFANLLKADIDETAEKKYTFWKTIDNIRLERDSLYTFAFSRTALSLDWFAHYNNVTNEPIPTPSRNEVLTEFKEKKVTHPFELYKSSGGLPARAMFRNMFNEEFPMINIHNNEYTSYNWNRFNPLPPKPEQYPPRQKYPSNPAFFIRHNDEGNWGACFLCHMWTGNGYPDHGRFSDKCKPEIVNPVVEIKQYPYGTKGNRGVRTLSSIKKDTIIGEYNGEFIPLDMQESPIWGDRDYAMDWDAPAYLDQTKSDDMASNAGHPLNDQTGLKPIATLISGKRGSWARFINHRDDDTHNVEFWPLMMGMRYRIMVRARRDIAFGEELTTHYGYKYGDINA